MIKKIFILSLFFTYSINLFCQKALDIDKFIDIIENNAILVKKDNAYFVIDTLGNKISNHKLVFDYYSKHVNFNTNHFFFGYDLNYDSSKNKKVIIFDILKDDLIEIKNVVEAKFFNDSIALVKVKNNYKFDSYFINNKGKRIFNLPDNSIKENFDYHSSFHEGVARISVFNPNNLTFYSKSEVFGSKYINTKGKVLEIPVQKNASDFSNGLALVSKMNDLKRYWGFINKRGKIIIDFKYSKKPTVFSDSISRVQSKNRLYGYINTLGDLIISPKYTYASGFYKGKAIVKQNGETFFKIIDKKENILKEFSPEIRSFTIKPRKPKQIEVIKQLVDENRIYVNNSNERYKVIINFDGEIKNRYKSNSYIYDTFHKGLAVFFELENGTKKYSVINKKGHTLLTINNNQF